MDNEAENTELVKSSRNPFMDAVKPGLILLGALLILLVKGYVSAKLLMGLIILDYFTTDLVKKIPLPFCLIISIALSYLAFA